MSNQNNIEEYNPRWFIWTVVFLMATGISLVGYITISEDSASDISPISRSHLARQVRK